jgi:hypothetical protein
MSALPPKADIAERRWHVRFVPAPTSEHEIWLRDPFRSIEVQVDEPALAGSGLDPPSLFPSGRVGTEMEISRACRCDVLQLNLDLGRAP